MASSEISTKAIDHRLVKKESLRLIGNRLSELDTALFFAPGTPLWRFPVTLIRNARADKEANIWFLLKNIGLEEHINDEHFFAQLQFYNKELQYYLKVEGDATVVPPGGEAPGFRCRKEGFNENEFLIKLRVCQANFYSRRKQVAKTYSSTFSS